MGGSQLREIQLPSPSEKGGMSLEEAIARRRSIRHFTAESISPSQLAQILWATQGMDSTSSEYRTVPSAGATCPLEIFVACGQDSVEGIGGGVYHYNTARHSLALHHEGDIRSRLAQAALGQRFVYEAPADIVIVPSISGHSGDMVPEVRGMCI